MLNRKRRRGVNKEEEEKSMIFCAVQRAKVQIRKDMQNLRKINSEEVMGKTLAST